MYFLLCIVFFSFDSTPDHTRLTVAHNREMYFSRPTIPAKWWTIDTSATATRDIQILAPQDGVRGGSWIGYENSRQRVAFLTNIKHPTSKIDASRGDLIRKFLESRQSASEFLQDLHRSSASYAGYRLVVFCGQELGFYTNTVDEKPVLLPPGIYGFSNNKMGEIWPRVEHGKALFSQAVQDWAYTAPLELVQLILPVMSNTKKHTRRQSTVKKDFDVPYHSSSIFVEPCYRDNMLMATRTTTVIVLDSKEEGLYVERNLDNLSSGWDTQIYQLPPLQI